MTHSPIPVISLHIQSGLVRVVQVVSSGLTPYKLPRALASLLIYQQPSSTTLYYSYLETPYLIDGRQEQWGEETIQPAMNA